MGKTMDDLMNEVRAAQQVTSEQNAELGRQADSNLAKFMARMDEHEDNMSKGFYHINETINQGAGAAIKQTRESEKRLSDKIDSIKGKALSVLDWVTIVIITILGGVGGWFFSKCMIDHQFAAWVDREDTINYVRDAAGNIVDITNTTTASTVWPTVILTIALFAIVGFTVAYAICSAIRDKEVD
jgi:hypothetical protein